MCCFADLSKMAIQWFIKVEIDTHGCAGKHRSGCTGANQLFAVHKMAVCSSLLWRLKPVCENT